MGGGGESTLQRETHLLVEVVGEDDEARRQARRRLAQERLEAVVNLGRRHDPAADLPVPRVKHLVVVRRPDDGAQAHLERDGPHAVVNVAVRRAERVGRDARDVLDDLHRPAELGDDLLVGERREGRVRPGVHRQPAQGGVEPPTGQLDGSGSVQRKGTHWWPSMYSVCTISGREMAREPTMKKVDLSPCDSRRLRRRGVYGDGPSSVRQMRE